MQTASGVLPSRWRSRGKGIRAPPCRGRPAPTVPASAASADDRLVPSEYTLLPAPALPDMPPWVGSFLPHRPAMKASTLVAVSAWVLWEDRYGGGLVLPGGA